MGWVGGGKGRESKASLYQELSGFVFLTEPLSCGFSPHLDQSLFCYMSIVLYVKSKLYLSFQRITGSQGYIKKKKNLYKCLYTKIF